MGRCQATGDPRYKTLDGARFDHQGTCRYVMLETKGLERGEENQNITIWVQNEHRNGNTKVSFVRSVTLMFDSGLEVQVGPGIETHVSNKYIFIFFVG